MLSRSIRESRTPGAVGCVGPPIEGVLDFCLGFFDQRGRPIFGAVVETAIRLEKHWGHDRAAQKVLGQVLRHGAVWHGQQAACFQRFEAK